MSGVQCRQHLVHKHFERGQLRKVNAVEHEIIYAEVDEETHLCYDLARGAHEAEVLVVGADAISGYDFGLLPGGCAGTAADPRPPHRRGIAANLGAGSVE